MEIKITKQTKLNGRIFYYVYVDGSYMNLFDTEEEAKTYADQVESTFLSGITTQEETVFCKTLTK